MHKTTPTINTAMETPAYLWNIFRCFSHLVDHRWNIVHTQIEGYRASMATYT